MAKYTSGEPRANEGEGIIQDVGFQDFMVSITPERKRLATDRLWAAVERDEPWAIRLALAYQCGLPQQRVDVTSGGETFRSITVSPGLLKQE